MEEDLFQNETSNDLFGQIDEREDLFPTFNPPTPKNKQKEKINEHKEEDNKER